jgi:hypothetical protein
MAVRRTDAISTGPRRGGHKNDGHLRTYPPLDTLKSVASNVWIVDGPLIRFPTRMTVIRLSDDGLFVHSPTEFGPALKAAVLHLGTPRWIVTPSRIHYWWLPAWHEAFPEAEVYAAPRVREQAGARIDFACRSLDRPQGYPWDGEIATLPIAGRFLTEVEFFHKPSRTLVLTDLIENFEADKLSRPLRWLMRLASIVDPHGGIPWDLRMTFPKAVLREAVIQKIAWNPERVILAHGRWYAEHGAAELRRAFRWLLK